VLLDAARTVRAAGGRLEVRPAGRGASVRLFLPHARGEAGGTP
jgi:hypothetical protein